MSNQFMVSYVYEQEDGKNKFGSMIMTQKDGYEPITQDVLRTVVNAIRETLELPESVIILPLGFYRLEGEK